MQLPRIRVRTLLIIMVVLAVLMGGGLEFMRLRRLSAIYKYQAWGYGTNVQSRLQDLAGAKRKLKQLRASPDSDPHQIDRLGTHVEFLQAEIASNANLVQIFEHAASHPWEAPPHFAESGSPVTDASIPRRYLTNPAPPEPYRPPEFDHPAPPAPHD